MRVAGACRGGNSPPGEIEFFAGGNPAGREEDHPSERAGLAADSDEEAEGPRGRHGRREAEPDLLAVGFAEPAEEEDAVVEPAEGADLAGHLLGGDVRDGGREGGRLRRQQLGGVDLQQVGAEAARFLLPRAAAAAAAAQAAERARHRQLLHHPLRQAAQQHKQTTFIHMERELAFSLAGCGWPLLDANQSV